MILIEYLSPLFRFFWLFLTQESLRKAWAVWYQAIFVYFSTLYSFEIVMSSFLIKIEALIENKKKELYLVIWSLSEQISTFENLRKLWAQQK